MIEACLLVGWQDKQMIQPMALAVGGRLFLCLSIWGQRSLFVAAIWSIYKGFGCLSPLGEGSGLVYPIIRLLERR